MAKISSLSLVFSLPSSVFSLQSSVYPVKSYFTGVFRLFSFLFLSRFFLSNDLIFFVFLCALCGESAFGIAA